ACPRGWWSGWTSNSNASKAATERGDDPANTSPMGGSASTDRPETKLHEVARGASQYAQAVFGSHRPRERSEPKTGAEASNLPWSAVAPREQELRAGLEELGTRDEKLEGIGQPIDRVEAEADRERVLDLRARDTGSQHSTHVLRIDRVLARQLA